MENALCSDGIPYGGDGGGDTDGTSGSNGGTVSREAKGTENGYLRASVLRRGTFGAKVPKTWKPFRQSGADWESRNDNMGDFVWKKSRRGRICPQFFYFSLKYAKKTTFLCLRKAVSTIILCFLPKQNHIRFSGFRHSSSGRTKRPSLRMSTSSNQISPPPYSGVMMSTRSQWIADLLPLGASS